MTLGKTVTLWAALSRRRSDFRRSDVFVCDAPAETCTAVGDYENFSGAYGTLAEAWNGNKWINEPTPDPTGATASYLSGVSCASATACTAVGYYLDASGAGFTLAEIWNGTKWAIEPTPNPTGAFGSYLDAVSCTSATTCTAVGYYGNASSTEVTLAEAWDGTTWVIKHTPNPTGKLLGSSLNSVSCTSASTCTAVGASVSDTALAAFAETWNGTKWTIEPTASSGNSLSSAGKYLILGANRNGTKWTVEPIANPIGETDGVLKGVSCDSGIACTAVGSSDNAKTGVGSTLVGVWNGAKWTLETTPNPVGTPGAYLTGVSCTSVTACTAVGYYWNSKDVEVALAENWNGKKWTIEPTPDPSNSLGAYLDAVSCISASACTAVGKYSTAEIPRAGAALVESWNGTTWKIEPTPRTGAVNSFLNGVSCASATACTAVGSVSDERTYVADSGTLAEASNGTKWVIDAIPKPAGAVGGSLSGVSCVTDTSCTAAGATEGTAVNVPLIERS
jgi:hypothetical protein